MVDLCVGRETDIKLSSCEFVMEICKCEKRVKCEETSIVELVTPGVPTVELGEVTNPIDLEHAPGGHYHPISLARRCRNVGSGNGFVNRLAS